MPADLSGPVVFLGMAETATALGQWVFAAYRKANPEQVAVYLQSSRQIVDGSALVASFEEGHSHATTHLIQVEDLARSEEHTSELQSLMRNSYAVFCLKKKNIKITHTQTNMTHRIQTKIYKYSM